MTNKVVKVIIAILVTIVYMAVPGFDWKHVLLLVIVFLMGWLD